MNRDPLDDLFAAARPRPDISGAEAGFESRLLARLQAERRALAGPQVGVWSWRLAPALGALVLALAWWPVPAAPPAAFDESLAPLLDPSALAWMLGGG